MEQTGGLLSHNVFAYCGNNPVMFSDPSGRIVCTAVAVGVTALIGVLCGLAATNLAEYESNHGSSVTSNTAGSSIATNPVNTASGVGTIPRFLCMELFKPA